ncbi:GntR family transcriptional regulator [Pseudarthrobacter sp. NIBRBAC000502772]|uniref:GntR family transcriptional regulator n=1 Tax=Pseudarthrobacter sp. NIBRBAC000502772 TaxID=2590775 RepID=UPI001130A43C|nr:GntR family transcriptional regulator [Pseudarthrobacter sp. NIBRBAC000502772]QDG65333.1 GntR family transcriptional regulator [Pseudarthrobacter sp. NIBRBAC000502772]
MPTRQVDESFADFAYRVLCDELIVLDIKPGEPLNDEVISKRLGVGRTPIREAMKRLESDHLVVAYPRRGTFAAGVDITDLAEISEIRHLLEPAAAARAARMASPQLRQEIKEFAREVGELLPVMHSQRDLMRLDMRVHRMIYRATGSRHLEDVLIRYDNLATRIWSLVLEKLPPVSEHIAQHIELLECIAEGDYEAAARLTTKHVTDFENLIKAVL